MFPLYVIAPYNFGRPLIRFPEIFYYRIGQWPNQCSIMFSRKVVSVFYVRILPGVIIYVKTKIGFLVKTKTQFSILFKFQNLIFRGNLHFLVTPQQTCHSAYVTHVNLNLN